MAQGRSKAGYRSTWILSVWCVFAAVTLVLAGCGGSGSSSPAYYNGGGGEQVTAAAPQVTAVSNLNAPGEPVRQGDWCQISGNGFGSSQTGSVSNGYVLFGFQNGTGGQADSYQQWTDTVITCRMPVSAKDLKGSRDALTITVIRPDADGSSPGGTPVQVSYNPVPNPSPDPTPPNPSPIPTPTVTPTVTPTPTPTPTPTATPSPAPTPTHTPTPTTPGGGGGGPTTGSIKVTVDDGTAPIAGATLTVTTVVDTFTTVADGTCTIANLPPGTYRVTASKAGYTDTQSGDITVTAGATPAEVTISIALAPHHLTFITQPSKVAVGTSINPAVTVEVRDVADNLMTTATTSITMAIGTDPAGGTTLSGTLSVDAAAGVATFSDPKLDKEGSGFALQATAAGLTLADSITFNAAAYKRIPLCS